jgi:hypothetical protein
VADSGRSWATPAFLVRSAHVLVDATVNIMRSPITWFLVLLAGFIVALYALRVGPKTHRQWVYLAITIAFLAWVLPLMVSLRSR